MLKCEYTKREAIDLITLSPFRYTARLKKRQDKKRARGKKGSVYEEEYLINSLRKLILRVDGTKCKLSPVRHASQEAIVL
jgi:hypothetical protein